MLAALQSDPATAPLDERRHAIVDYALRLTKSPSTITETDIATLRKVGLSDSAIHDAAAVVAYFNFVNRVALGLGVELEDKQSPQ